MDAIIVALATIVAIGATMYTFALTRISFLKKNWVEYRCNPIYMPVAGMVGDNIVSNFTKCSMKAFHDYAGFMMDPIMAEFSVVNDTISEVSSTMDSMRSMMSGVRGGFLGIIGTVFGKISNLMSQFQYTVIRMRTLLNRIVGVMMSFVYIFSTGMSTGTSIKNGPIGKTMGVLCFQEDTIIQLNSGEKIAIKNARIGDVLQSGSVVTSIYKIQDQVRSCIYNIRGVYVTGTHKIKLDNNFVYVYEHPDAKPELVTSPNLVCLNTSDNRIRIGDMEFLDFVESDDDMLYTMRRMQLEMDYNNEFMIYNSIQTDKLSKRSGVSENARVVMHDGTEKRISKIKPGDILIGNNKVIGVIIHNAIDPYYVNISDKIIVTPCTWILDKGRIRVAQSYGRSKNRETDTSTLFIQLITSMNNYTIVDEDFNYITLLDEIETKNEEIFAVKDAIIKSGSFRGKRIV